MWFKIYLVHNLIHLQALFPALILCSFYSIFFTSSCFKKDITDGGRRGEESGMWESQRRPSTVLFSSQFWLEILNILFNQRSEMIWRFPTCVPQHPVRWQIWCFSLNEESSWSSWHVRRMPILGKIPERFALAWKKLHTNVTLCSF